MTHRYGHDALTPLIALKIARGECKAVIPSTVRLKINASERTVREIVANDKAVYGINTGFGPLCQTRISPAQTERLQKNILLSHSVGVGDSVETEIARLMMVLKVHSLSLGYSGIALKTIERILWHIENDIIPLVPEQGSVGASGDLAPLAHLFLPLIGRGQVLFKGKPHDTASVLKKHGLRPLTLGPKEGLALINGTQFMAAHAIQILARFHNCLENADLIGALSVEAMMGSVQPFQARLHALRPFKGARLVAARLTLFLKGSGVLKAHADCCRVQDPYSLRCMPQVHGASRDAWLHLFNQTLIELNAVTDNPVIFSAQDTISGGNFHGQPLALPLDYCAPAASELGNISERRTYLLLEGKEGLPPLLMKNTGINSGFMIPQYTAAALVSENKSLCFPASADSIPTSAGQEDHVSMGAISARKTLRIVKNLENILAIELLCGAQAFDFRRPLKSGKILEACHDLIRKKIAHAVGDRVFSEDIARMRELVVQGMLVKTAQSMAQQRGADLNGKLFKEFELK